MFDVTGMTSGSGIGGMATFGKNRDDHSADRAEAVKLGKGVQTQDQLEAKVRDVAEQFTSVFMNQMMKSMRNTVEQNPEFHGDNGEKFFQDLLDTEQSKSLAQGSGYGLTDLIYESMMTSYRTVRQPDGAEAGNAVQDSLSQTGEPADVLAVSEVM